MARIMVAMSGGVDSSVAAALLVEQGHDVIGVHMRLHGANAADAAQDSRTCCGVDDASDARRVADRLGFPYYVLDLEDAFREAVYDPFIQAWTQGRTPNPCVACNGVLKFHVLLRRALALGCDQLATGHYCRVDDDGAALRVAADPAKDQSYFLYPLTTEAIAKVVFPLGDLTKAQVRELAAARGLATAQKPESMDVCFLPDHDHAKLVQSTFPELDGAGEIVTEQGLVVGHHDGYWRFTIGQRHGLGVALGFPAFVTRIDAQTRRVYVGGAERLMHTGLRATDCVWAERPAPAEAVTARIRHRGPTIPCRVQADGDQALVFFDGPARAVTPGQAVVFYRGERVLGGGTIDRAVEET